jgi:single-strand DNA-binding protein
MSDGINQVFLFGNLGTDPELRHTSAGPVLKLRLATNRSWLDKETNTRKEETEWHRVTVFGRRGEAVQKFLHKGSLVFIVGRLHTSSYEKDGQKRYSTEIIAEDLRLGGHAGASPSSSNGGYHHRPPSAPADSSAMPPY